MASASRERPFCLLRAQDSRKKNSNCQKSSNPAAGSKRRNDITTGCVYSITDTDTHTHIYTQLDAARSGVLMTPAILSIRHFEMGKKERKKKENEVIERGERNIISRERLTKQKKG